MRAVPPKTAAPWEEDATLEGTRTAMAVKTIRADKTIRKISSPRVVEAIRKSTASVLVRQPKRRKASSKKSSYGGQDHRRTLRDLPMGDLTQVISDGRDA